MFVHKSLAGKVVVVTGASSGLGRETAVQFASRGCTVMLAARRAAALDETAQLCWVAGGHAQPVVTDVTQEDQVQELARATLRHAGRIDIWVNNAGVTLFEPLENGPFEEHRRVIETNLFGAIHGARAVVPIFRAQHRGVLINVGSVLGKVGQPFVPAYVISKFALRGLTEALRSELADERGIHVCSIFPYAIDTPHFEAGANRVGRRAHAMPPVQSPEKVARAIVRLAARPRHERHVPRSVVLGLGVHRLFPRTTERLLARTLSRWHFDEQAEPPKQGNLYRPGPERAAVRGTRQPRAGTPRVAASVLRELVDITRHPLRGRPPAPGNPLRS